MALVSKMNIKKVVTKSNLTQKIPVGVSACLLGESVRYDGGHKKDIYITDFLTEYFEFRSFCPEIDIGLGVPRKTIKLVRQGKTNVGEIRCVGSQNPEKDFTAALMKSADDQSTGHSLLCGYIVKRGSPSCGMEKVKVHQEGNKKINRDGVGVFSAKMIKNFPGLPVVEESGLMHSSVRESFIQRVFFMFHWKKIQQQGITKARLLKFHSGYFDEDLPLCSQLAALLQDDSEVGLDELAHHYSDYVLQKLSASEDL